MKISRSRKEDRSKARHALGRSLTPPRTTTAQRVRTVVALPPGLTSVDNEGQRDGDRSLRFETPTLTPGASITYDVQVRAVRPTPTADIRVITSSKNLEANPTDNRATGTVAVTDSTNGDDGNI